MRNLTGQNSIGREDDESNLVLHVGALVEVVGMKHFASRKFILALSALGVTAWLCAAGHIDEGVYSAVVIATVGTYIAGNVGQKVFTRDVQ